MTGLGDDMALDVQPAAPGDARSAVTSVVGILAIPHHDLGTDP